MKKFFVQLIFKKDDICAICDQPFNTYAEADAFAKSISNQDIYAAEVCVQYAPPPKIEGDARPKMEVQK